MREKNELNSGNILLVLGIIYFFCFVLYILGAKEVLSFIEIIPMLIIFVVVFIILALIFLVVDKRKEKPTISNERHRTLYSRSKFGTKSLMPLSIGFFLVVSYFIIIVLIFIFELEKPIRINYNTLPHLVILSGFFAFPIGIAFGIAGLFRDQNKIPAIFGLIVNILGMLWIVGTMVLEAY